MLTLVVGAAVLIGGVQATQAYVRAPHLYRTVDIFLTHSLAWFAMLYLVAGCLAALEHRSEPARG